MVVVVISVGFGSVFFSLRWVAKIFIIQFLVESYIEKEKVLQLVLKVLNMQNLLWRKLHVALCLAPLHCQVRIVSKVLF